ncbi:hypothetical protein DNTS_016936 [Danionella cerebrum]|uniref:C-type lectin domain-containing protein n=1 Tax=Danionella cerebrum TaxID=2873325 RepID=A0A553QG08_9TELE|nr:hypothetical protein DNTS_016936 [Danionella translucida]
MCLTSVLKMKTTLALLLILELGGLSSGLFKRHFYVNLPKTWSDAKAFCQQNYQDLSSFRDENEKQQFLEDAASQTSNAWVGLKKDTYWKWSEGSKESNPSWDTAMHQPDNSGGNCAFLYDNTKKLHDGDCTSALAFFCMRTLEVIVEQQSKTWEDAERSCRENSGDLASLNSWIKITYFAETIGQAQTPYVWVGLRFLAGKWFWVSGEKLSSWASSVTSSECPVGPHRCVAVNKITKFLTVRHCEEQLSFLCSKRFLQLLLLLILLELSTSSTLSKPSFTEEGTRPSNDQSLEKTTKAFRAPRHSKEALDVMFLYFVLEDRSVDDCSSGFFRRDAASRGETCSEGMLGYGLSSVLNASISPPAVPPPLDSLGSCHDWTEGKASKGSGMSHTHQASGHEREMRSNPEELKQLKHSFWDPLLALEEVSGGLGFLLHRPRVLKRFLKHKPWKKMKTALALLLLLQLSDLSSGLLKQHFFVDQKKSWNSAQSYCKAQYDDLSSFNNESEQQTFVQDALSQTSNAWVGLSQKWMVWRWSGEENATQIQWDASQPDGGEAEKCAFIHSGTKRIHDEKCSEKLAFFCMLRCVVEPGSVTWLTALDFCREHYNDLAILNSENRINIAYGNLNQAESDYVWTGLRFLAGRWRWISGDDLDNAGWDVTEPSQCPAAHLQCGAVHRLNKTWMPRDCDEQLSFICHIFGPHQLRLELQELTGTGDAACSKGFCSQSKPSASEETTSRRFPETGLLEEIITGLSPALALSSLSPAQRPTLHRICFTFPRMEYGDGARRPQWGQLFLLVIAALSGRSSGLIKQHFFVNEKMSWSQARKHCLLNYNDLSTFTDEAEEQQFLEDIVHGSADGWVGLHKLSNTWMWLREEATHLDWDSKQPGNETCVFFHKGHKKLNSNLCNATFSFYCMKTSDLVLVQETQTWQQALKYCRQHHIDLAGLSSQARMSYALKKVPPSQTEDVWMGLRFLAGEWFWVTGDDQDYTRWSETAGSRCPGENLRCGAVSNITTNWINRDCEVKLNVLCSTNTNAASSASGSGSAGSSASGSAGSSDSGSSASGSAASSASGSAASSASGSSASASAQVSSCFGAQSLGQNRPKTQPFPVKHCSSHRPDSNPVCLLVFIRRMACGPSVTCPGAHGVCGVSCTRSSHCFEAELMRDVSSDPVTISVSIARSDDVTSVNACPSCFTAVTRAVTQAGSISTNTSRSWRAEMLSDLQETFQCTKKNPPGTSDLGSCDQRRTFSETDGVWSILGSTGHTRDRDLLNHGEDKIIKTRDHPQSCSATALHIYQAFDHLLQMRKIKSLSVFTCGRLKLLR